jgi:murein DD-endopeptidase MepM/ murein hydrolase activator NlpD
MQQNESNTNKKRKLFLLIVVLLLFSLFYSIYPEVLLANLDEIRNKIYDTQSNIQALEDEIRAEQAKIDKARKQARTLQEAIDILNAEIKKTDLQIQATESKIKTSVTEIDQLSKEIYSLNRSISNNSLASANIIRNIYQIDSISLVESLLSKRKFSDIWVSVDSSIFVSFGLKENIANLKVMKKDIEDLKNREELKKKELLDLKSELADRKKIAAFNKKSKDDLLKETKNQESNYMKILEKKKALKEAFEQELLEFESQLKLLTDPSSFPQAGKGILKWPIDNIKITQKFGKTEFSNNSPGLYSSIGHNGVDFAAPIGTPIKAALSGIVEGTGDTDLVCPGASYGKWILIKHNNGLSTLYAHLSLIKVSKGDKLQTSEVIGYSGNTGYSTGPHLHFTVYASQGVQIISRPSKACQGVYTMPVADLKAYLDPLNYL